LKDKIGLGDLQEGWLLSLTCFLCWKQGNASLVSGSTVTV